MLFQVCGLLVERKSLRVIARHTIAVAVHAAKVEVSADKTMIGRLGVEFEGALQIFRMPIFPTVVQVAQIACGPRMVQIRAE